MAKKIIFEEFIKRAKEVHGDKYDYSEVEIINSKAKIKIRCIKHNHIFEQVLGHHLRGSGCPLCARNVKPTTEEFIRRAIKLHGDKYDYSEVDYKNSQTKIYIGCPEHGIFQQFPNIHLRGWGCPECIESRVTSKGEKELCQYIKSVYSGKVLENTRKFIGRKELDIYLPELKLAFEYNGNYWHALYEEKDPGYHDHKRQLCKDAGITLIEVWENDWKKESDKIKKEISNIIKSKAIV